MGTWGIEHDWSIKDDGFHDHLTKGCGDSRDLIWAVYLSWVLMGIWRDVPFLQLTWRMIIGYHGFFGRIAECWKWKWTIRNSGLINKWRGDHLKWGIKGWRDWGYDLIGEYWLYLLAAAKKMGFLGSWWILNLFFER